MSAVPSQQPPRSVLVLDDDDAILLVVSRILTRAGYTDTRASDGREAIDKLRHKRFDAIVLDLMMPDVSGYEVIAHVKQHDPGRRSVIVVSAAAERAIDKAPETVVAAKLRKPFDLVALLSAVSKCVAS